MLKRLRGTPLPAWTYLAGQIAAAVLYSTASLLLTLGVAVLGYDVQLRAEVLPALTVTLLVGIAAFAALGLAIAAVSSTAALGQALSIGSAIVLAFISGLLFVGGELPAGLTRIASVFLLKPYADALTDQFDPYATGAGWDLPALGILLAWGLAGAVVASRAFRWEPRADRPGATRVRAARRPGDAATAATSATSTTAATSVGRPSAARLVFDQARAANRATWRDPGSVLLVLVPVGLYGLFLTVFGGSVQPMGGIPFAIFYAASMITWGTGTAVFMNMPEALARARDRGVLKRLRGTPLPARHYLAGGTVAGLGLTLLVAVLVLSVGAVFFGLRIPAAGLALELVVIIVGTPSIAACGFLLAALVPNSRAVGAVGLMVLFVLAFFSDIFLVGAGPEWMGAVGSVFPLRNLQNALTAAWDPAGPVVAWGNLAVLAAWSAGAGALAVRFFRWDPRRS
ncbi:ABC transporter permease [Cryobacterium sp. TMT2-23]|uniref:ABC transporter permease n=1 Tax=Cryobacterium sp. TMT2-23 TaxID=1259252 RepID=UPI0021025CD3|nr:ABC transporter permease [Cryobacterium sp. TMT2-23]